MTLPPTHTTHPTSPMPSHVSLHISLNVCHVTSHHPPHTTHDPTPPHPCIPTHPYTYPPMFVMLLHTTQPTPPMPSHASLHISPMFVMLLHKTHPTPPTPSHASLHISPNVCHVTSHHPSHPTQAYTHTPHQQPMPSHASLPYPTLKYF